MNAAGLDYYDRVVDELLANGIEPLVHAVPLGRTGRARGCWRLARGAVPPRPSASTRRVVGARLGDRVCRWITLSEPWVIAWLGYGYGVHAPGPDVSVDAVAAAHHVLLAHGLATAALRAESAAALVGVSVDLETSQAAT